MTDRPMIHLDRVTKVYPGASAPAVEELTLDIKEGEILERSRSFPNRVCG